MEATTKGLATQEQPPGASKDSSEPRRRWKVQQRRLRPRLWTSPVHHDPLFWIGFAAAVVGTFATYSAARSWDRYPWDVGVSVANAFNIGFVGTTGPWFGFLLLGMLPATVRYLFRLVSAPATLMAAMPKPGSPPGWMADPFAGRRLRYWDGVEWTRFVARSKRGFLWPWMMMVALGVVNVAVAVVTLLTNPVLNTTTVYPALTGLSMSINQYVALTPPPTGASVQTYRSFLAASSGALHTVKDRNRTLRLTATASSLPSRSTVGLDQVSIRYVASLADTWAAIRLDYVRASGRCLATGEEPAGCLADAYEQRAAQLGRTAVNLGKGLAELDRRHVLSP